MYVIFTVAILAQVMADNFDTTLIDALLEEQRRLSDENDRLREELRHVQAPAPAPAAATQVLNSASCPICMGPVMTPVLVGCPRSGFCGNRQHGQNECTGAIACLTCVRTLYGRPRFDADGTPRTFNCLSCRAPLLSGAAFQQRWTRRTTIADLYIVLTSLFPVYDALYDVHGIVHECPRCNMAFSCQGELYRHMSATRPGTNVAMCRAGFPTGIVAAITYEEISYAVQHPYNIE